MLKNFKSFIGDTQSFAGGNPCELVTRQPEVSVALARGRESSVHNDSSTNNNELGSTLTRCYTWPTLTSLDDEFNVMCEQHGRVISCCGHGLLSAACYWLGRNQREAVTLLMNGSKVAACSEGEQIWLRFTKYDCQPANTPLWLGHFFPSLRGVRCATVGGDSDYLVIQWPDNTDLTLFDCPDHRLGQYTRRALICTSRQCDGIEDIHYRYFAPQYSPNEDSATGSAMRVLVSYYRQAYLRAVQVSQSKGLLFGRLNSDSVSIGGYCCTVD